MAFARGRATAAAAAGAARAPHSAPLELARGRAPHEAKTHAAGAARNARDPNFKKRLRRVHARPGGRAALARRGHGAGKGGGGRGWGTRSRRDQPSPHAPTRALNTTSQRCASTPYCKIPKRVDTHWLAPRGEGLPGGTDAAASSSLGSASVLRGFTMGAFYLKIRVFLQSFSEGAIWVPCANPKAPRFTGQTSRARGRS